MSINISFIHTHTHIYTYIKPFVSVEYWKRLPSKVADSLALVAFKTLEVSLNKLILLDLLCAGD